MQSSISRFFLSIIFLTILVFAFAPGQWTPAWVVNHDKFSHLIVFFFLGFMVLFSWPQISKAILLAGLVGFAVFIELLQFSVFNRGFSGIDLVYDFIGIGLFLIFIKGADLLFGKHVLIRETIDD